MGLKGSKSMFTFFSLPSSVTIVPQYMTRPFGGTEYYIFREKLKKKKVYIKSTKKREGRSTLFFFKLLFSDFFKRIF